MKYNDNGEYKDIYIKTFDTLPVGAIVEYNGATIPDGWTDIGNNQIQKTSQYIEGGAGLPSYFTTETNTGMKWIDGKDIYRKVVEYQPTATIGAVGQSTNISIPHNVTNMEQCIKCDAFINSHYRLPVGYGTTDVSSLTLVTTVHPTNGIGLRIINDTWQNANIFYFIIEYTKSN